MSKVIFALWGDELPTRLRDGVLHERLAAAGVRRLQVNVPDELVEAAMRIDHLADPIGGFVSVWDTDPGPVAAVLADVGRVAGYAVDERRRLDPPEHWDGRRADGLANMAVLRRPAELDRAEWLRRWMTEHTAVGIRTQATFGYVQNIVERPVTESAPVVDGIVEEHFPIEAVTDMHAFYGSGGDDADLGRRVGVLMESVGRIGADRDLDLVPTARYLYDLS
ncbi:hypothetical protein GON03_16575 [Nocardioides sp. MAH-18]|uniref:Uncharacterized protein n=1 Tax=Nocardioides agri TaxID=2682843 RepID=A0A6L6XVH0_9ACTN|nr:MULTISPECIES: EthD domain-containing protein [unclassified Nocardioides]MBA2955954.1 EthD domain-containing protein [Nocardioides sp. CGMCC 1.13656]MVQ50802.1 hypothetical protein [Nocardioides sp. MAH-18]